jgi:hypothetical protein
MRMKTILGSLALIVSIVSCGSAPPTGPVSPGESLVPERPVALSPGIPASPGTLILEGQGNVNALFSARIPFTTTAPGVITVIADWTSSTNDLNLWLVVPGLSSPSVRASTLNKPERLVSGVMPAGDYFVDVLNLGPERDTFSFQIFLAPNNALD